MTIYQYDLFGEPEIVSDAPDDLDAVVAGALVDFSIHLDRLETPAVDYAVALRDFAQSEGIDVDRHNPKWRMHLEK